MYCLNDLKQYFREYIYMSSYQIVLVERGGNLKEKKTKNIDTLYKVCNYRNDNHFSMQTTKVC